MNIYFLRHASAGEPVANKKKDEKRGLDKEGIEQCGYVGRALTAMDVQIDAMISSPLKRSTQTASFVANEMGHEGKLQIEAALRPEAIMVVGHNPNLSEFLGRIISSSGCEASIELRKGALARVEMKRNAAWLHWCMTPKILRTLYAAATESSRPKTSRK